jgi:cellulose synthase/poly-beta-1,6-N-acetylglucosamine synthase-like glycosyltransferase
MIVLVLLFIVLASFFIIQILCLFWIIADVENGQLVWMNKENKLVAQEPESWPVVSILLAARNEEHQIIRSLSSILALDYPTDKLQVLIGDDMSTDNTAALIEDFIKEHEHIKLIYIKENLGKGRGKANVLAHLAHEAKGEYFFITDVDVALPEQWIKGMLKQFKPEVGIASGITMCERGKFFATMQSIDWLHFMGYIKAFARVGVGSTSVGNNMAVRKDAYWETGGYENIDFSITEDYKLFQQVTKNGWKWSNSLSEETLGIAKHLSSPKEMLHQRKRWLIGARELPLNWKIMIVLYGLFIPALAALFIINVNLAILTWFLKLMAQSIFIAVLCLKLKVKPFTFAQLMVYEFYVLTVTFVTAVFYFLPVKSRWKGRVYNSEYLKE